MHSKLLMNLIKFNIYFSFFCVWNIQGLSTIKPIKIFTTYINDYTQEIRIVFHLTKKDFLYKDFISFATAHPLVHLSPWQTTSPSFTYYDRVFKGTKEVLKNNIVITTIATADIIIKEPVYFYCAYYQRSANKIQQVTHKLSFTNDINNQQSFESIHTHLEISGKQEKNLRTYSTPFNVYLMQLFIFLKLIITSSPFFSFIHIIFILFIIFLCLLQTYFLKKLYPQKQLYKDENIIITTLYFIIIMYILYHTRAFINACTFMFLTASIFFILGIFYIKKSTHIYFKTLRALCNFCGILFLILAVPIFFKALQLIDSYINKN
jgi:hypothetical protein